MSNLKISCSNYLNVKFDVKGKKLIWDQVALVGYIWTEIWNNKLSYLKLAYLSLSQCSFRLEFQKTIVVLEIITLTFISFSLTSKTPFLLTFMLELEKILPYLKSALSIFLNYKVSCWKKSLREQNSRIYEVLEKKWKKILSNQYLWICQIAKDNKKKKEKKEKKLNLEEKLSYLSNFEVKLEKIAAEFEIRRLKVVGMQRFILKKKID